MSRRSKYAPELRERAVRMELQCPVTDIAYQHRRQRVSILIGVVGQHTRRWHRQCGVRVNAVTVIVGHGRFVLCRLQRKSQAVQN